MPAAQGPSDRRPGSTSPCDQRSARSIRPSANVMGRWSLESSRPSRRPAGSPRTGVEAWGDERVRTWSPPSRCAVVRATARPCGCADGRPQRVREVRLRPTNTTRKPARNRPPNSAFYVESGRAAPAGIEALRRMPCQPALTITRCHQNNNVLSAENTHTASIPRCADPTPRAAPVSVSRRVMAFEPRGLVRD